MEARHRPRAPGLPGALPRPVSSGRPPNAANEYDPTGTRFAFEMGAGKTSGGQGWADVAKMGYFGWEYKGKDHDLDKAYEQLLRYRDSLQNPPVLVVSDINRIIIRTNFTNLPTRTITNSLWMTC